MNRDLNELTPTFKVKVEKFLSHCHMLGLPIFITEGYRSQERQNELYAQGRTSSGNVVTWTKNSLHTKRIAVDIAFDGEELYPNDMNVWKKVIEIAKGYKIDNGYTLWGKDIIHFQDDGQPLQDIEQLITYGMNDKQKKVLENNINACGLSHDHGTEEQQKLAQKQASELRNLLTNA